MTQQPPPNREDLDGKWKHTKYVVAWILLGAYVVGLAVSVVVSWLIAVLDPKPTRVFVDWDPNNSRGECPREVIEGPGRRFETLLVVEPTASASLWEGGPPSPPIESPFTARDFLWRLDTRNMATLPMQLRGGTALGLKRETYGWPFYCMYWNFALLTTEGKETLVAGVRLGSTEQPRRYVLPASQAYGSMQFDGLPQLVLPFRPAIFGLLANGLVYGGGLLLILGFVGLARQAIESRRARRQQCPQCGYPMVGLQVCPECGGKVNASNG